MIDKKQELNEFMDKIDSVLVLPLGYRKKIKDLVWKLLISLESKNG